MQNALHEQGLVNIWREPQIRLRELEKNNRPIFAQTPNRQAGKRGTRLRDGWLFLGSSLNHFESYIESYASKADRMKMGCYSNIHLFSLVFPWG